MFKACYKEHSLTDELHTRRSGVADGHWQSSMQTSGVDNNVLNMVFLLIGDRCPPWC